MADEQKRGFIEKNDSDQSTENKVHYITRHSVKKDSLTTPIRIVFDCSCHESSEKASLNYFLTTGIEKAFLQIDYTMMIKMSPDCFGLMILPTPPVHL